ncbi:MAG: hypothetical protein B6D58_02710 [candidate division Zixibacteria bacterium 4484_95]|nr:MAG: hypothetical protein B6D58_02710 [candidate division Zixibacteria bacterium 4484_95]
MNMEKLTWVSHPAKIRKTATIIVLLFIVAIFIVVYSVTYSILMVMLAGFIFLGTLSTFFFPTKYELTKDKIKIKYLVNRVEKEMKVFRSYYPDKNGVLLSPFTRPSRLENFRGLYVRYHQNKDEVDSFIKKIFEERKFEDKEQLQTE